MREIFVLAEHRQGEVREITFELLTKGRQLAEMTQASLTALLLGHQVDALAEGMACHTPRVLVIDDSRLGNFNAEVYQRVLSPLIEEHRPLLTLMGHTALGVDLAPSLAVELGLPLITDCVDLRLDYGRVVAVRQVYGGKVNAQVSLTQDSPCLATIRSAVFPAEEGILKGDIVQLDSPLSEEIAYRKFVEYIEATVGDVDISQADVVIGVGRGIKEEKNMELAEELAHSLRGVLAGSRPVVDAGWLPKDRQVGSSGKTIKPKLYVALGISGAFQHVAGVRGAEVVVAVNKDPRAPIFSEADYGIVGDLFKVVPALRDKIAELRG